MRILVVGPGALGVCFAARLAHAGHDVVLACRNKERAAQHGLLKAVGPDGSEVEATVPAVGRPKDAGAPFDALLLATKVDAAEAALKTWLPVLSPKGVVVSLLNGLQGDRLAAVVPDRLLVCTVAFPATLEGTGVSRQTGAGELVVGPWPDARVPVPDPAPVAGALAAVAPTRIHANMRGVQWTKLLINASSTTLGALTGLDFGVLLADKRAREAFLQVFTEGYEAGLADGVRFEKVLGIDPRVMALPPHGTRLPLRNVVLAVMRRRFRAYRSSSLQSLRRGQRSEAVHLNGAIQVAGRRTDTPTPVNDAALHLMDVIDDGRMEPSSDHLDRLLRAAGEG